MASYDIAYKKLKEDEGGFSLRSSDPGGYTYMGLTRKDNPGFANFNGYRGWDVIARWVVKYGGAKKSQQVTFPDATLNANIKAYIFLNYWKKFKCDLIADQHLAAHVYDFCFNSGKAAFIINQTFKQPNKNIITVNTVNALNNGIPYIINTVLHRARLAYVINLKMKYKGANVSVVSVNPGLLLRINSFKDYKSYGTKINSPFQLFWS